MHKGKLMRPTFSKISNFDETQRKVTQHSNNPQMTKKLYCDMNNNPAETTLKKHTVDEKWHKSVIKHERNI